MKDYRTESGTETVPTTTLYQAGLQEFWLSQPDKLLGNQISFPYSIYMRS